MIMVIISSIKWFDSPLRNLLFMYHVVIATPSGDLFVEDTEGMDMRLVKTSSD